MNRHGHTLTFLCVLGGLLSTARAAIFTVDSTGDAVDVMPGDNVCDDGAGDCTLRAAIMESNAAVSADTIAFNISGTGPHTIQPASVLPGITDPVVIDGYTQPGATANTNPVGLGLNTVLMIELDGSLAGTGTGIDGLKVYAGHSTVRGLVINHFDGNGIVIAINGDNLIEGNFIGA